MASFLLAAVLSESAGAAEEEAYGALLAFTLTVLSTLGAMYKSEDSIAEDFEQMLSRSGGVGVT